MSEKKFSAGRAASFVLAVLALVFSAGVASAVERITDFKSEIVVSASGLLKVRETIAVISEGRQIRRGIYRDFPVRYRGANKYWRKVGFKITGIKRDGANEPYFTKSSGDYVRIYIGRKDVFLRPGKYVYEISYETTRQLRYFKQYDELYWNVTGTKWAFPIDRASAEITLPKGAEIIQEDAFTGRYGSRGRDVQVIDRGGNAIAFETTRGLRRYEGLTVAVGWQKGIVALPGNISNFLHFLYDNIGAIVLAFGTLATGVFYFVTWFAIGRDPQEGIVIPLFEPPQGFSPAAVSYVHFRRFKAKGMKASLAFIAALVSLAVKKQITIDKSGKDLTVSRTDSPRVSLPKGEQRIYKTLLGSRKSITFKQSVASTVQSARSKFRSAISQEYGDTYFRNNLGYFFAGIVLSAVTIVIFMVFFIRNDSEIGSVIAALASAGVGAVLLSMGARRLGDKIPGGSSKVWGTVFLLIGIFAILPSLLLALHGADMPGWVMPALVALVVVNVIFYNLLHAPTELGQKVMDQIEGFKLYLSVAEADRLNMTGAPEVTPQVFEKFLPFAIALGVEKPWSKALEDHMAKIGRVGDDGAYHPTWYTGSDGWSSRDLGAATAGIVSGVAAGMTQATPPSSSGSSGGGGGFSGGGGGGGGGGGW